MDSATGILGRLDNRPCCDTGSWPGTGSGCPRISESMEAPPRNSSRCCPVWPNCRSRGWNNFVFVI